MGAYSPYPREINIYFLQGGVLYIYSTERVAKEGDRAIKNAREREKTGAKRRICEIFGAIARLGQLPFSGEI